MKVKLIDHTQDAELKIAKAAGICYNSSVTKPTQLLKRLKKDGHLATMRFANATIHVSEISRACSMQLLRHAFISVLQRSQRYCKESEFGFVIPPEVERDSVAKDLYLLSMKNAQHTYDELIISGMKAEDARYVLPNACYTEMVLTGNFQAWIDLLYGKASRLDKHAQWEIRYVAQKIQKLLEGIAPTIFKED